MRKIFFPITTILGLALIIGCNKRIYDENDNHTIGTFLRAIEVDGETREFIIHVPSSYDTLKSVPLMLNFHGWTMTAEEQMEVSDMRSLANSKQFILVYPQGTRFQFLTHWNVGSWTTGSNANDLGFTEALIQQISTNYNIDEERIYACGYSNGGFFSYELACQLSHKIAAIGSVAGNMSTKTVNNCNPSHPTPVITVSGTMDDETLYDGSESDGYISHSSTIDFWVTYNNVDAIPIITNLPNTNTADGDSVILYQYLNGANNTEIDHYKVINGGHGWPGSSNTVIPIGNMDINANSVIWDFVSQFDINGKI